MTTSEVRRLLVRRAGDVAVVELTGDIDGGVEGALAAAWDDAVVLGPAAVALGFDRVGYINSTGIALVVGLLSKAQAWGIPLRAYGLSAHYREIFEITRLADYLDIHEDETTAVTGVRQERAATPREGSTT
jgi:anti-anti-sigma factor